MYNAVWCFVGGWPYLLHKSISEVNPEWGVRPMTSAEIEAMRKIGVTAKELILAEVERQRQGGESDVR
jgi:hypothetical protein